MGARISMFAAVAVLVVGVAIFSLFPTRPADSRAAEAIAAAPDAIPAVETPPPDNNAITAAGNLKRGMELLEKKSYEAAATEFQEAVRLTPRDAQAHYYLGYALEMTVQLEDAMRQYELAVRFNPSHAMAHAKLGELLAQRGDLDGAIASYRQALAVEPANGTVRNNLATALNAKGEFNQAIGEVEAALRSEPENTSFMINLGTIQQNKGDLRAALDWFTKACNAGDHVACGKQRAVSAQLP